jgi:predicted nucleotidyltransferase component of viral defense system
MRFSTAELDRAAAQSGFQSEPLEKVLHLLELLEGLRSHPFLGHRLVLEGDTALNLFVLDLPRLSVDIDLNYCGRARPAAGAASSPRRTR